MSLFEKVELSLKPKTISKHWRIRAAEQGIARGAIERMEPAFAEKV
ncbi:MAG: hypothetical protein WAT74_13025 [Flavobacteriales bacterium]